MTEAVCQATEETFQLTFRQFLPINIKRQDQLIQPWLLRHDRIQERATDEVHMLVRNEPGGQKRIPTLTSDGLPNLQRLKLCRSNQATVCEFEIQWNLVTESPH